MNSGLPVANASILGSGLFHRRFAAPACSIGLRKSCRYPLNQGRSVCAVVRACASTASPDAFAGATWPGTGTVSPSWFRAIASTRTGERSAATSRCSCWFSCAACVPLHVELLDLVADLNALEMLPGVETGTRRDRRAHRHAPPEFAQPRWRRRARQPRIIDPLYCVILGHDQLPARALRAGTARRSGVNSFPPRASSRCAPAGLLRISSSPRLDHFFRQHPKTPFARQRLKRSA